MKLLKKILCCFFAAALLLCYFPAVVPSAAETQYILENKNYLLTFDVETGGFNILEKSSAVKWESFPHNESGKEDEIKSLISVEYINRENFETSYLYSYTECVLSNGYTVDKIENKIDITFNFKSIETTVPVTLALEEDGFSFTVKTSEIETKNENIFIVSVSVLPYFGAATTEEDGYIFVPDGSGALINFGENTSKEGYSANIYGGDAADKAISTVDYEEIRMPVFGIKKGNSAFLGILTQGESDCSIQAYANGQRTEYANIYTKINVGKTLEFNLGINKTTVFEKAPIKNEDVNVRFIFLKNNDADYSGMARRYREYLTEDIGFKKMKIRNPALYVDVYAGTVVKKSAFLFTYNGYTVLTSAEELEEMLNKLKSNGIGNINVRYLSSNKDEAFSKIVDSTVFHSKLKYKKMSSVWAGDHDGIKIFPAVENMMTYTNENYLFSRSGKAIKDIAGITVRLSAGCDAFGNDLEITKYILKPELLYKNIDSFSRSLKKDNIPYFAVSDITNTLYSDYSGKGSKLETLKDGIVKGLEKMSENTVLSMEDPNIYAAQFASSITDAPLYSSGYDLFDADVPFWHIVMSGFTEYSGEVLNEGYNRSDILRMIETGTNPRFAVAEDYDSIPVSSKLAKYYSTDLDVWISQMTEIYRLLDEVDALTQGSCINAHRCLSDGVYRTEFANGAEIFVNYNEQPFTLEDGRTVGAQNYLGGEVV